MENGTMFRAGLKFPSPSRNRLGSNISGSSQVLGSWWMAHKLDRIWVSFKRRKNKKYIWFYNFCSSKCFWNSWNKM